MFGFTFPFSFFCAKNFDRKKILTGSGLMCVRTRPHARVRARACAPPARAHAPARA
jgi:hypothetical protein